MVARAVSYNGLIRCHLHQLGGKQGMLGRTGSLDIGDQQAYFLIGSPPLGVQLTVVAEGYLQKGVTQSIK